LYQNEDDLTVRKFTARNASAPNECISHIDNFTGHLALDRVWFAQFFDIRLREDAMADSSAFAKVSAVTCCAMAGKTALPSVRLRAGAECCHRGLATVKRRWNGRIKHVFLRNEPTVF
jgi:hypothetical protein